MKETQFKINFYCYSNTIGNLLNYLLEIQYENIKILFVAVDEFD